MQQVGDRTIVLLVPQRRRKLLFSALAFAVVCYAVFQSVLWPVRVLGDSMQPNYHHGARHFVNKLAYWSQKPQRGDVVTVRVRTGEFYIKRIVGLPGETVEFRDGRILINSRLLPEDYTDSLAPIGNDYSVQLAEHDYFVIGDNRATSVLGAIPIERIVGKVIF